MKYLTLINNVWKVRVDPNITDEEKAILENNDPGSYQLKKTTIESIRSRSLQNATSEDAIIAQNLYDSHKIENSNLISVDIMLPNGKGIINCRINEQEHKQIRF